MRPLTRLTAAVVATLALVGCAASPPPPEPPTSTTDARALTGELTVFAAASLAGPFDELAARFEAAHPDVDVRPISYDGSSTLATQIIEGARADVFAAADEATMAEVAGAGLAADPQAFATNTLTIVVPVGNPGRVTGLADLADPDLVVVLCAPEVPCGRASARLLDAAGVTVAAASSEQSVTAVLTKVTADEADAGLVYVTDAAATDAVEPVTTIGADEVVNVYPIAALADAPNPAAAAAFVDFVRGAEGREVLAAAGFGTP